MSGARGPSILVLSSRVYVKSNDGCFYPGVVETKDDLCRYTVQFVDGSRRRVNENDLVWLGFLDLPALMWPRHPVIQPCASPTDSIAAAIHSKIAFGRNENDKNETDGPEYFKIGTCYETKKELSTGCPRKRSCLNEPWDLSSSRAKVRLLNEEASAQPRSSVLRLNHDLLQIEDGMDFSKHLSFLSAKPPPVQQSISSLRSPWLPDESRKDNERICISAEHLNRTQLVKPRHNIKLDLHSDRSTNAANQLINDKEELQLTIEHETWEKKDEKQTRSRICETTSPSKKNWTSNQWEIKERLEPSGSRIIVPKSSPTMNKLENMPPGNEASTVNTPHVWREKRGVKFKREMTKKCRKIFGIKNRQAWCVQCKWKKACSRFVRQESI